MDSPCSTTWTSATSAKERYANEKKWTASVDITFRHTVEIEGIEAETEVEAITEAERQAEAMDTTELLNIGSWDYYADVSEDKEDDEEEEGDDQ